MAPRQRGLSRKVVSGKGLKQKSELLVSGQKRRFSRRKWKSEWTKRSLPCWCKDVVRISALILIVALFHSDMLIFYRIFAAQRFVRHLCISKAGTFLSIHFSIFFSRNDVSGQCLRGAEGESSPQSPPAGAFLLKKKRKKRKKKKTKYLVISYSIAKNSKIVRIVLPKFVNKHFCVNLAELAACSAACTAGCSEPGWEIRTRMDNIE